MRACPGRGHARVGLFRAAPAGTADAWFPCGMPRKRAVHALGPYRPPRVDRASPGARRRWTAWPFHPHRSSAQAQESASRPPHLTVLVAAGAAAVVLVPAFSGSGSQNGGPPADSSPPRPTPSLPTEPPSRLPGSLPSGFPGSLPSGFPSPLPSGFPSSLPRDVPSDLRSLLPPWTATGCRDGWSGPAGQPYAAHSSHPGPRSVAASAVAGSRAAPPAGTQWPRSFR